MHGLENKIDQKQDHSNNQRSISVKITAGPS